MTDMAGKDGPLCVRVGGVVCVCERVRVCLPTHSGSVTSITGAIEKWPEEYSPAV